MNHFVRISGHEGGGLSRLTAAFFLLILLACQSVYVVSDSSAVLLSWNDSDTKSRIIDFVQSVTQEGSDGKILIYRGL
ncbi:hypothetical protein [Rahnella woolbedingensis]|uniref:Uncharacterized protein n=1 Tax=Rahnella woolbedingensis TaxID=1510574 RepID=A0A419N7P7_9GAMM|nr:hypothetical protein [Rahnella woolbedingensis]RJT43396.1 hypothetical protein D6C13_14025 [Rahnella woolbedingensis]